MFCSGTARVGNAYSPRAKQVGHHCDRRRTNLQEPPDTDKTRLCVGIRWRTRRCRSPSHCELVCQGNIHQKTKQEAIGNSSCNTKKKKKLHSSIQKSSTPRVAMVMSSHCLLPLLLHVPRPVGKGGGFSVGPATAPCATSIATETVNFKHKDKF